jgi:CRP-like cAMP-binding protein
MKQMRNKTLVSIGAYFDAPGRKHVTYRKGQTIFTQGDPCSTVLYLRSGAVKTMVVSKQGKEAVLGLLGPGDFLGEGCIGGSPVRLVMAKAIAPTSAVVIDKTEMIDLLHDEKGFADGFINYMVKRNIKIEEDLVDQLFNSSERRLARALLMIAHYGQEETPHTMVSNISQETLAEMIGTTRSRVNFFMNKFRRLGFIQYSGGHNGALQVHSSLLTFVLQD